MLGQAARKLNLAEHKIANTGVSLHLAGDVEGHLGRCGSGEELQRRASHLTLCLVMR